MHLTFRSRGAALCLLALILAALAACSDPSTPAATVSPTVMPASTPSAAPSATAAPTRAAPGPDEGLAVLARLWEPLAPGVELRRLFVPARYPSTAAQVAVVRVDPARAAIDMHYERSAPLHVLDWLARLDARSAADPSAGPLVVMNAGFFQGDFTTAGLIVAGGLRYGDSFGPTPNHAEGMFSLVGGVASIRALAARPYDPAEPLDQAVQGLPMLVDGGAPADFAIPDHAAKRTVLALDGQGRLLLIHVGGSLTLLRLQGWLLDQRDLGIVTALNLDGGSSAGMIIPGARRPLFDDSGKVVPAVMAVSARVQEP